MNESRKTSNEAYESTAEFRETLKSQIVLLLTVFPMTDDELEVALDRSHQTISATRRALVKEGRIEANGEKRATRSGRRAQVWQVVQ